MSTRHLRSVAPFPSGLTDYEAHALVEIRAWIDAGPTRLDRAVAQLSRPGEKLLKVALRNDRARAGFERAMEEVMTFASDVVAKRMTHDRALQAHGVASLEDIAGLPLVRLDVAGQRLRRSYLAQFTAQGMGEGATGFLGPGAALAGIVAGVPAVVALSLRTSLDFARHYGFDPNSDDERLFTGAVLAYAADPTDLGREAALFELYRVLNAVAHRAPWQQLEQHGVVRTLRQVAERTGVRLTQRRLAYVVPALGMAVGGGLNAHHAGQLTTAAYQLNRARHIGRRLGVPIEDVLGRIPGR